MLLRTKKFTPKLRDSQQSNFLHHLLSRSPPEFLHQLGNFTPAMLVLLVRFCISDPPILEHSTILLPLPHYTIFRPSCYFRPCFGLSWPAGAEFGKMTYTIVSVLAKPNFEAQLVKLPSRGKNLGYLKLPQDPYKTLCPPL